MKIRLYEVLVKKRIVFMVATIAIAIICAILMPYTKINSDLTKYLPDDSQMKQGLDQMSETFGNDGVGNGMIRVMFNSLDDSTKSAIKENLYDIDGVAEVIYQPNSPDYNSNDHTLYEIMASSNTSQLELAQKIQEKFGENTIVETSQDDTSAKPIVMLIALALLVTVLLIMCESWLEPPLFLLAIGIGVVINMGTNALLEHVSVTTNSIAAILQLVLSIDYSIILMNRYRQEKNNGKEKKQAMTEAVKMASSSIFSSAFTTIVGLLALVFMNLKVGADMGIVLAKGVLCSLIAIFTVLPSLILLCDSAIEKSKKRVFSINTDRIATAEMKFRIPLAILFVVIFAGAYFLHNKTEISFSIDKNSSISEIFPEKNTTVLLYENTDSTEIIGIADSMLCNPHIKAFISYHSILQKKYSTVEMDSMIKEMTALTGDLEIPFDLSPDKAEELVNMLYYIKSGMSKSEILSLHDFASTIADISADSSLTASFTKTKDTTSSEIKITENIGLLTALTDTALINKKMSSDEIAEKLKIDGALIDMICPDGSEMSIKEIIHTAKELLAESEPIHHSTAPAHATTTQNDTIAASRTDIETTDSTTTIHREIVDNMSEEEKQYSDTAMILQKRTPAEMAQFIGMKKESASLIFNMYGRSTNSKTKYMSAYEFIYFINHELSKRKIFASQLDDESRAWLSNVEKIMTNALSSKSEDVDIPIISHISETIETTSVNNNTQNEHPTPVAKQTKQAKKGNNKEMIAMIDKVEQIIEMSENDEKLTSDQLYDFVISQGIEIDKNMIDLLYLYHGSRKFDNDSMLMSIEEILNVVEDSIIADPKYSTIVTEDMKSGLMDVKKMIAENFDKMKGNDFSRAIIFSDYPKESDETNMYVENLKAHCDNALKGKHYLIGESVMMNEMRNGFDKEMTLITLLTVLSIFLIVAITFKSLAVPSILVITVMSAVFVNVYVSGLGGQKLLYLSYLIMQSILMGATIDYGILLTNNYRESRMNFDKLESLKNAYRTSIHTILTSGMIMTFAPLVMALLMDDPTTIVILRCIAIGAFTAMLIILFILPSLLASLDRFIIRKKKKEE